MMEPVFQQAMKELSLFEGGYSDNPKDKGGETYKGISRNNFPKWEGWKIIDKKKPNIPDLTDLVEIFYWQNFWNEKVSAVNPRVAAELFEASVNCGTKQGMKFLQRGLNCLRQRGKNFTKLVEDGIWGNNTKNALSIAINKYGEKVVLNCQNGEQYIYYKNLDQHQDFPGWFKRV